MTQNLPDVNSVDPDEWKVYEVACEEDLRQMLDYSGYLSSGDEGWVLDGVVANGCRWCSKQCPAMELQRVIVGSDGRIRPCLEGPVLGSVTDSLETLRGRARQMMADLEVRRGCQTCSVSEGCSKCLLPSPSDDAGYCEIRRSNTGMSRLVASTNLLHTFHPADF